MPTLLAIYIWDPNLFVVVEDDFTFWQLTVFMKKFTPKEGIPRLLAEIEAIIDIMLGYYDYLLPDWEPKISSATFIYLFFVGAVEFYTMPELAIPMGIW